MTKSGPMKPNPKLDLVLERVVDVPRDLVWAAWTEPKHVLKWFTPKPWTTVKCEIDLRPGGKFYTVMRSPDGEDFPNAGCFLEVKAPERLAWTSALLPGYRPVAPNPDDLAFTAILTFEAQGKKTRYVAVALHPDEATRKRHEEMGFHEGWGAALDQLVAHMKSTKK